jgi:hypothetical protein
MDHRLHATASMAESFYHLFVNRRGYTLQSTRPHPETGRHYYYRPKARDGEAPLALSLDTVQHHLAGELTLGIYAINPHTQRSKWVAIDVDYKNALVDLLRLQSKLQQDGVEPALEKSNRGGHLWIFFEEPALARDCRVYIYHTALRLGLPIKGAGLPRGSRSFLDRTSWARPNSGMPSCSECPLVRHLQTELSRPGSHDGRTRH